MKLEDAIKNTKRIYLSDSMLNTLLDFERVLDELDLFAFENWLKGELVSGPIVEKYWVTCSFMWPRRRMPDPRGAARLLPYDCKVSYEKSSIKIPVEIKSPDDFQPGTRKAKLTKVPIWIVTIRMPQELISDIESGSLEIANEEYDLEDIQSAYKQDMDQKSLMSDMGEESSNDLLGGL